MSRNAGLGFTTGLSLPTQGPLGAPLEAGRQPGPVGGGSTLPGKESRPSQLGKEKRPPALLRGSRRGPAGTRDRLSLFLRTQPAFLAALPLKASGHDRLPEKRAGSQVPQKSIWAAALCAGRPAGPARLDGRVPKSSRLASLWNQKGSLASEPARGLTVGESSEGRPRLTADEEEVGGRQMLLGQKSQSRARSRQLSYPRKASAPLGAARTHAVSYQPTWPTPTWGEPLPVPGQSGGHEVADGQIPGQLPSLLSQEPCRWASPLPTLGLPPRLADASQTDLGARSSRALTSWEWYI